MLFCGLKRMNSGDWLYGRCVCVYGGVCVCVCGVEWGQVLETGRPAHDSQVCTPSSPLCPEAAAGASEGRDVWCGALLHPPGEQRQAAPQLGQEGSIYQEELGSQPCRFGGSGIEETRSKFAWFLPAGLRIR